jgi:SNF family Na+-dependent transporter
MAAAAAIDGRQPGLGAGHLLVRLWLLLLILAGLGQLYFIMEARSHFNLDVPGEVAIFRIAIVSVALRVMVLAAGLYFFHSRRSPASLYGLVAAMLFFAPVAEIVTRSVTDYVALGKLDLRLRPVPGIWELGVNLVVIGFLLLSRRVNDAYGIRTRDHFIEGVPRLWTRLRGRTPING